MRVNLADKSTDGVLAGAISGRSAFSEIISKAQVEPAEPTLLILDFASIELATASYMKELVFGTKSFMRSIGSRWYPIVANADDAIKEELRVLTEARKDAIIVCDCDEAGEISNPRLFGDLDSKQVSTFNKVAEKGTADASSLMQEFGEEENTGPTAWNNRLAGLVAKGVLMEFKKGRAKLYRPAW